MISGNNNLLLKIFCEEYKPKIQKLRPSSVSVKKVKKKVKELCM